jgi:cyclopropane fatty-acyl-phospholipid synthase-like methyltransferase
MLRKAQTGLAGHGNVDFVLLKSAQLPADCTGMFDFVYSFDVFVHLDLHTMWKYFREIQRVLKTGGTAFLHTSNLMAPGGWKNFSEQNTFEIVDHYFISPEIVSILARQSGLKIIKTSTPDPTNFYLNRDYLFILKKD